MKRKRIWTHKKKPGKQLLPGWQDVFLKELEAEPYLIGKAAEAAGVSRSRAYMERDANPEFRAGWDLIIEASTDELERTAHYYAKTGERHESATLLIFMLKARRKAIYGGVGDGPERVPDTVVFKDGRNGS